MKNIIVLAFFGVIAQLIDGTLGMTYGVTSTTLLLWYGLSPAIVSTSVHLSKVVTSCSAGISHARLKNVDYSIVKKMVLPGAAGAFLGAAFLSKTSASFTSPFLSLFLFVLGGFVVYRFLFQKRYRYSSRKKTRMHYRLIGFIAGFFDSTGGGGWGAITTPLLLTNRDISPNKAIGSVSLSEFAVALSASIGFFLFSKWDHMYWQLVLAMMVGGVMAAPIAAYLVKKMKPTLLGTLAGGLIMITNLRIIFREFFSVSLFSEPYLYFPFLFLWFLGIVLAIHKK